MQMEEQEARGKRPEQEAGAALASAYIYIAIGGLRTKIWAGVEVPPASGTPTQLAESVDPTKGHSLRVPPPPPPAAVRMERNVETAAPGGYTVRYFTSAEDTMAGQRDTCPCSSLHSTSSPHTLGLMPGDTTVWLQRGWLGASGTQYLSALGLWQSSWQWRAQPWSCMDAAPCARRERRLQWRSSVKILQRLP